MLLIMNTVQFLLCVVPIILHAIFLYIVFIVVTDNVLPYLSHVNGYLLAATIIYNINVSLLILVLLSLVISHGYLTCSLLLEDYYRYVRLVSSCYLR